MHAHAKVVLHDPVAHARDLLRAVGITGPPTDVMAVIDHLGIRMKGFAYRDVPGHTASDDAKPLSRGWLRRDDNGTVIMIHRWTPSKPARFTLMHEVAHAFLPWHAELDALKDNYFDDPKTRYLETEANAFAAEMLMPEEWFARDLQAFAPGWYAIRRLSRRYDTSLEATWIRYLQFTPDPCAVLRCTAVKGKWVSEFRVASVNKSHSFRWHISPEVHIKKFDFIRAVRERGVIHTPLKAHQLGLSGNEIFDCQAISRPNWGDLLVFLAPRSLPTSLPKYFPGWLKEDGLVHISRFL